MIRITHTHTHIALIAVLLSAALAGAEVKPYMIPLSSPFYDMIDALYAMTGAAKPVTARPWSYAEARLICDALDETRLPEGAAALLDEAREELAENQPRWLFNDGIVGFSARATVSLEGYLHKNRAYNMDEDQLAGRRDWYLTDNDRLKLVNGDLDFSAGTFFYAFMDVFLQKRRYTDPEYYTSSSPDFSYGVGSNGTPPGWTVNQTLVKGSSAFSNIFNINIGAMNGNFPDRAFGAFGGDSWFLTIGRERMNWGDSHISNLLIDDSLDYQDAARFAVFTKNNVFRYEILFSLFDGYPIGNQIDKNGLGESIAKAFKLFMGHRFDIRPLRWLSFSVTENTMFNSRYAGQIHPQWANPFYFFHNINMRNSFNSMLWLELNVAPVAGLNIYGQFAFDQGSFPGERSVNDEQNAWGALAGAEYTRAFWRGYFTASLEGAYTTPWLYRRDKTDFIVWLQQNPSPSIKPLYLGFSYGGDAIVANADVWYNMPGVFKAGFIWQGLIHGAVNMFTLIHENDDGSYTQDERTNIPATTPSGDPLYQMMFTLAGEYQVPEFVKWMSITARASATLVLRTDPDNGGTCDAQFTLGASVEF